MHPQRPHGWRAPAHVTSKSKIGCAFNIARCGTHCACRGLRDPDILTGGGRSSGAAAITLREVETSRAMLDQTPIRAVREQSRSSQAFNEESFSHRQILHPGRVPTAYTLKDDAGSTPSTGRSNAGSRPSAPTPWARLQSAIQRGRRGNRCRKRYQEAGIGKHLKLGEN